MVSTGPLDQHKTALLSTLVSDFTEKKTSTTFHFVNNACGASVEAWLEDMLLPLALAGPSGDLKNNSSVAVLGAM